MEAEPLLSAAFETSFGWIGIARSVKGIRFTTLPKRSKDESELEVWRGVGDTIPSDKEFGDLPDRLRRYFDGEVVDFPDVLDLDHATPFRQVVWATTRAIGYGETRSYLWVAEQVGRPSGPRAVGQAMGANPVPIIVPCHRVIGSDGGLGGFGGGLDLKERMLRLESASHFHR